MALPKSKYSGPRRGGVRVPPKLDLCRGCDRFITIGTETCHHCGADVAQVNTAFYDKLREARAAAFEVDLLLRRMRRRQQRAQQSEE